MSLTYPLLWLGIFAALALGPASPADAASAFPVDLRSSVIGAIAGYMSLWLVYHLFRLLTGKEGMGYGDFKLLAAIGAWLGWKMLLPTILFSAAVGAVCRNRHPARCRRKSAPPRSRSARSSPQPAG